jgi:nucleotide-binding universal stress UspA family protein
MPAPLQIRRILCPTDFSVSSARALRHAGALSLRFGAPLSVLHVIPFAAATGASLPYFPTLPQVATDELRKQANEQLRGSVAPLQARGCQLALELREGEPWREICESAQQSGANLLVMGTHGRGALERMLLGSVAETVLRNAPCPVLTLSHEREPATETPGAFSRIVCATDLSEPSQHTVDYAVSLAVASGARLTLLHVLEGLPSQDPLSDAASFHAVERFLSVTRQWAAQQLRRAVSDEARARCEVEERVVAGRPSKKILELAAELSADLVVMGWRTKTLWGAPLFGSNALHVVRAARCPVLNVHPPRPQKLHQVPA